jgi:hypothetical protein
MDQPPASACNTDPEPLLTPGHWSPRSGASGHRFAGPLPRVAPEKRDQLGHRSHAPATFFEVRFASLFEARCRLFVSAITRLGGMTRSSFRIPARRGPRPSSLGTVDLPCGRDAVRAGDAPSRSAAPPTFSPPAPTPTFADVNSRWIDACDTANSARPMPGERREGRRTKRRTRHRGRVRTERGHAGCHRMAMADGGSPPWRSPDTRVSGMTLTTRLGVGATRGAKPDEARLPAPTREGRRFPREPRCLPPPAARTRDEGSLLRFVRPVSDSRRPHAPRSRA